MNKTLSEVLNHRSIALDTIDISTAIHLYDARVSLSEHKDSINIKGTDNAGKTVQKNFHLSKVKDLIDEAERESSSLVGDLKAIQSRIVNDHGVLKIRPQTIAPAPKHAL
jgi:hypothetical protein